jgi:hypothetical protein
MRHNQTRLKTPRSKLRGMHSLRWFNFSMAKPPASDSPLVLSYLGLRKAVGVIGIALPFVLALGKVLFDGPGIESSISSYYYTAMRDVFVGSLCAIAVFLMSYKGYERKDDIAGDLAFIFAIGVALFPTAPDLNPTSREKLIGGLHHSFAALFFLTLAYFSLILFRKTDPSRRPTRRKEMRNVVYTVCGYTILASLALIALVALLPDDIPLKTLDPVFWLEAVAVVAFGVSWLVKGEAILKDDEH